MWFQRLSRRITLCFANMLGQGDYESNLWTHYCPKRAVMCPKRDRE